MTANVETWTLTNTYTLDAAERVSMITAATDPWATVWSRFVAGPDEGISIIKSSDGSSKIQITNMHDDLVTQIDKSATFTGLDTYAEQTEDGIARNPDVKVEGNYGWPGGHKRSTDTVGGLTLMGARLNNPVSGRFLSMDPVPGGNDYTLPARRTRST